MILRATDFPSAFIIEPERLEDERGFFARTYDRTVFEETGLASDVVQCNISFNRRRGTLRGMHYQIRPFEEDKLVRCISGAIFDVMVDLRSNSPTFLRHLGLTLTAENRTSLYIPKGCAHGFLTLVDNTEVTYQMSAPYSSEHARGIRWDDPAVGIQWPAEIRLISERDRTFPDFEP